MPYQTGDLAHFHNEFRDPHTGDLVDPSTVVFKHETPAGVETTLTYGTDAALTQTSTGRYQAAVSLNAAGTWNFEWVTSGTYQGVDSFSRVVEASQFS